LKIRQLTRKDRMPTKSTNKQIVSSKISTSAASSSQGDVAQQLAATALQFVMGGQGLVPPGLPNRQMQKKQSKMALKSHQDNLQLAPLHHWQSVIKHRLLHLVPLPIHLCLQ
jgi:hypothetical protein